MRIMLDTNAYSAFKRGDEKTVQILSRADEILLPVPVLGELRSGFRSGNREAENIGELNAFLSSPRVRIHPLGEETAIFYAEVHCALRAASNPIPANDVWIAAAVMESGSVLITRDSHFDAVAGIVKQ